MRDTYLQLSGGAEYQVSNDRRTVQYRHKPSGLTTWTHFATAPSGMEIEEIKEWHNMCIVKLDDDRWYQRSMNGHGLTLTEEEKRKDYNAQKAEKKARKAEKKARKAAESNLADDENDDYDSFGDDNDNIDLGYIAPTFDVEESEEDIQKEKYYEQRFTTLDYNFPRIELDEKFKKTGFFNIEAKIKNKMVQNTSEKRDSIVMNLNSEMSSLRYSLILLEKVTRRLLKYEHTLSELRRDDDTNFFGLYKNRSRRKDYKSYIKESKNTVIEYSKSITKHLKAVNKLLPELKDITKKLFELTSDSSFQKELDNIDYMINRINDSEEVSIAKKVSGNLDLFEILTDKIFHEDSSASDSKGLKELLGIKDYNDYTVVDPVSEIQKLLDKMNQE